MKRKNQHARAAAIVKSALEKVETRKCEHSCVALWQGAGDDEELGDHLALEYALIFAPDSAFIWTLSGVKQVETFWLDREFDRYNSTAAKAALKWRLTALAFLLAMIEAGDFDLPEDV